jgi:hypothetical protein
MFGLEKKEKGLFEFDLEKELKGNAHKLKDLMKQVEARIQSVKSALREGSQSKEFDNLGVLLNAYTALLRVLTRISNKK